KWELRRPAAETETDAVACRAGRPGRVRTCSVAVPGPSASSRPRAPGALETPRTSGRSTDHTTSSPRSCVPTPESVAVAVAVAEDPTARLPGAVTVRRVTASERICSGTPVLSPAKRAVSVGAPTRSVLTEPGRTTLETVASVGSELLHSTSAVTSTVAPPDVPGGACPVGGVPTAPPPAGPSPASEVGGELSAVTTTSVGARPTGWASTSTVPASTPRAMPRSGPVPRIRSTVRSEEAQVTRPVTSWAVPSENRPVATKRDGAQLTTAGGGWT